MKTRRRLKYNNKKYTKKNFRGGMLPSSCQINDNFDDFNPLILELNDNGIHPKTQANLNCCWINSSLYAFLANYNVYNILEQRDENSFEIQQIEDKDPHSFSELADIVKQFRDLGDNPPHTATRWDASNYYTLYELIQNKYNFMPDDFPIFGDYGDARIIFELFLNLFERRTVPTGKKVEKGWQKLIGSHEYVNSPQELCNFLNSIEGYTCVSFTRTWRCIDRIESSANDEEFDAFHFIAYARVNKNKWRFFDSGNTINDVPLAQTLLAPSLYYNKLRNACPKGKAFYISGLFIKNSVLTNNSSKNSSKLALTNIGKSEEENQLELALKLSMDEEKRIEDEPEEIRLAKLAAMYTDDTEDTEDTDDIYYTDDTNSTYTIENTKLNEEEEEEKRIALEKRISDRNKEEREEVERIASRIRAKKEEERLIAEKAKTQRLAAEKSEAERILAEKKSEAERISRQKEAYEWYLKREQQRFDEANALQKAEEKRIENEKASAEEKRIIVANAAEQRIAEEQKRITQEQKRIAEEKAEQEQIIVYEKAAEEKRISDEKAAKEEERIAEEKRIVDEKAAEEQKRIEEEQKRIEEEQKRIAEEKAAEEKRIAEEKAAEEKRIADEKAAEEKRIAEEEQRIAEEQKRIADEEAAKEEERIAAEKLAKEQRIAAEKAAEEQRIAEEKKQIEAQKAEEERIEAEKAEAERVAADKAEKLRILQEKAEQEQRIAEEEAQRQIKAKKDEEKTMVDLQQQATDNLINSLEGKSVNMQNKILKNKEDKKKLLSLQEDMTNIIPKESSITQKFVSPTEKIEKIDFNNYTFMCPNKGCSWEGNRKDLESHLKICPYNRKISRKQYLFDKNIEDFENIEEEIQSSRIKNNKWIKKGDKWVRSSGTLEDEAALRNQQLQLDELKRKRLKQKASEYHKEIDPIIEHDKLYKQQKSKEEANLLAQKGKKDYIEIDKGDGIINTIQKALPKINIEEQKSLPKPKKWPKVDTTKGEFVPPIPQEQKNEKTPEEKAKEEESENLLRNIEEMITKPMPKPPIVEIPVQVPLYPVERRSYGHESVKPFQVVVESDYDPGIFNYLDIKAGETIIVIGKMKNDINVTWLYGYKFGSSPKYAGKFPTEYLSSRVYSDSEPSWMKKLDHRYYPKKKKTQVESQVKSQDKSNLSFAKGEEVFYQKSVDEKVLAKIVKIHYDDIEPYYTIMLPDGSEKQTIYARLTKII